MSSSRIPSPARSQKAPPVTPRRYRSRATRSVGSPARPDMSGRLSSVVDEFKRNNQDSIALSPLDSFTLTVFSDNTEIEMPKHFILSESEDEIPDIQPRHFAFQKPLTLTRRSSAASKRNRDSSPTSSMTTDIEMEDWKLLPSLTMVEHQHQQSKEHEEEKEMSENEENDQKDEASVEQDEDENGDAENDEEIRENVAHEDVAQDESIHEDEEHEYEEHEDEIHESVLQYEESHEDEAEDEEHDEEIHESVEQDEEPHEDEAQDENINEDEEQDEEQNESERMDVSDEIDIDEEAYNNSQEENNDQAESHDSEEEEVSDRAEQEEQQKSITELQQSIIENSNDTHDTTGRNRKKPGSVVEHSPEAVLNEVKAEMDSFTVKGRNTSIRKTKSILKNFTITSSEAPPRESTGFSDGTDNSSAAGSGWDSHRTTRRTLRQTFGKDFTPRKPLRALVMEKSAKRQTIINEANANLKFPQANSTELNDDNEMDVENVKPMEHEVSLRTRQTTLDMVVQRIQRKTTEWKLQIEENVRKSLEPGPPVRDVFNYKGPSKITMRRENTKPSLTKSKKRLKPTFIDIENLPPELAEDMKYKPPKRFCPRNASWVTKRLYKYLETKLEPRYGYEARVRAEKFVETLHTFVHSIRRERVAPTHVVNELKKEMARLDIIATHFDFYNFFRDFLPKEVKLKLVPDLRNNIELPREGVFSPILLANEQN